MISKIKTNKIQFKTLLVLGLFFLFTFFPVKVLAVNCCETNALLIGNNGAQSNFTGCKADDKITEETCKTETVTNANSTVTQTSAVFVANATCNKENKCDTGKNVEGLTPKKLVFKPINFKFNIPLPGFPQSLMIDSNTLSIYVNWLFKFTVGVAGLLAVFMITVSGLIWVFAGGNSSKVSKAKEYIAGAVIGLLLAIFSYSILYIINPQLVLNKFSGLPTVGMAEINPFISPHDVLSTKGEGCFYNEFGRTPEEVYAQLVLIECPALNSKGFKVHKKAANAFIEACKKIPVGTKTLCGSKLFVDGAYDWRFIAGSTSRSLHSWGIAVDVSPWQCYLNVPVNYPPLAKIQDNSPIAKGHPHIPSVVIDAFKSTPGFRWGGDYTTKGDNMHFEWLGPCAKNGSGSSASAWSSVSGIAGNGNIGLGGLGVQCTGPIVIVPKYIKSGPEVAQNSKKWKFLDKDGNRYAYQLSASGSSNINSTLVVYFHGQLSDLNTFDENCYTILREIAETGDGKYALACVRGSSNSSPWSSGVSGKFKNAVNEFKIETGNVNPKIIVAGHSNGYYAMNQLIKSSSDDAKISKYIWLDACYDDPASSSKVVGIETTTTNKTNAPCKCSSIENRYSSGINHLQSRWALSDILKAIN